MQRPRNAVPAAEGVYLVLWHQFFRVLLWKWKEERARFDQSQAYGLSPHPNGFVALYSAKKTWKRSMCRFLGTVRRNRSPHLYWYPAAIQRWIEVSIPQPVVSAYRERVDHFAGKREWSFFRNKDCSPHPVSRAALPLAVSISRPLVRAATLATAVRLDVHFFPCPDRTELHLQWWAVSQKEHQMEEAQSNWWYQSRVRYRDPVSSDETPFSAVACTWLDVASLSRRALEYWMKHLSWWEGSFTNLALNTSRSALSYLRVVNISLRICGQQLVSVDSKLVKKRRISVVSKVLGATGFLKSNGIDDLERPSMSQPLASPFAFRFLAKDTVHLLMEIHLLNKLR